MLLRFGRIGLQVCLALIVVVVIASCGGGGGNQSAPQNNATVAPPASPMTEVQKEIAALPLAHAAPIPKGLNCKGDVVWVNTTKKTYHVSGDPYFGRTKHGEYMCRAAADAAGYHVAGTRHGKHSSSKSSSSNGN